MLEPIYTDWWPESWGPFGRGAAAGMIVGTIAGAPFVLAAFAYSQWHAPTLIMGAALVWMASSTALMLRLSHRKLMAERDQALAALAERHAAETTMYDEWVAECRRHLSKGAQR